MNRQVPKKYTIVGDGKVARHFGHYFDLLEIPFNRWSRRQSLQKLQQFVAQTDVVLLLISDDEIARFIENHPFLHNKILVHFSGTLSLDSAFGCHPLMTFGQALYDLATYQSIPFVCDEGVDFKQLLPQLGNPFFSIAAKDKAFYHAMCVMAGNFSQMLMRETAKQLNERLEIPADILFPYLLQNTKNFIANPEHSATGPLQRGDFATINKHLHVLKGNDLEGIYKRFVQFSSTMSNNYHHRECGDAEGLKTLDSRFHGNDKSVARGNDNGFFRENVQ